MPNVKIHLIAGARPNFMKIAPLYHALKGEEWCTPIIVHTGQHYDAEMSDAFFQDLKLPPPDINLGIGSGSHAEQTGGIMIAYERICVERRPDWVVVVGDVNSTLACTLAAKKLCIPVAHLEAGLRSGDRTMPEEINRIVTDALADLLWTPSPDADDNLRREGVAGDKIMHVGNIMIDSYELLRERIESEEMWIDGFSKEDYGVVTLHRPVNVDDEGRLRDIVFKLKGISELLPLVFPMHPRTRQRLKEYSLASILEQAPKIKLVSSQGYIKFMSLVRNAKLIITDSGGVQEETTYLNIPCLTLRETTERPITITQGTNRLVSTDILNHAVMDVINGNLPRKTAPKFWDGKTAIRVAQSLKKILGI